MADRRRFVALAATPAVALGIGGCGAHHANHATTTALPPT